MTVTETTRSTSFDPTGPWRLADRVAVRDEAFGALAYHYGTRRLVFLKSRELVALVRALPDFTSADEAVRAVVGADAIPRYRVALASLAASGVLVAR